MTLWYDVQGCNFTMSEEKQVNANFGAMLYYSSWLFLSRLCRVHVRVRVRVQLPMRVRVRGRVLVLVRVLRTAACSPKWPSEYHQARNLVSKIKVCHYVSKNSRFGFVFSCMVNLAVAWRV